MTRILTTLVLATSIGLGLATAASAQEELKPVIALPTRPVTSPIYGFEMKEIDGTTVQMSKFRGKVCLFVNVASKCGLTPQYKALQELHDKYKEKGFTVVGFPANNFRRQEPGTDAEILQYCKEKYAVSFPMFSKISVKGDEAAPLYKFLTEKSPFPGEVQWNFQKYLVGRNGSVLARFEPTTNPDDPSVIAAIEKALEEKVAVPAAPLSGGEPFPNLKPPTSKDAFHGGPTAGADALKEALATAAKEEKKVFVHFSADWCGWCKKLEAFAARPEIAPIFAQDFVTLKITTDHMQDGSAMLKEYAQGKSTGIPFLVFLAANGDVLDRSFGADGKNTGYPSAAHEIDSFMKQFTTHAKRATPEQIEIVRKTLVDLGEKRK